MHRTPQEQLVHFLSDLYSLEQQSIAQLVTAPEMVQDPTLAAEFREHQIETERQAELVQQRLEAHGGSTSAIKDAVMWIGGKGFLLFARSQDETPGRLVVHAYSYESMEWAAYDMLVRFAEHAGDSQTTDVARAIRAQERAMMERLERGFDAIERLSHAGKSQEELRDHLREHLAEVHAFESQTTAQLKKSEEIAGNPTLETIYSQQFAKTRGHARAVEQRLAALGSDPSTLEDSALGMAGVNWGVFFQAQSDTPAKLAGFQYAVLHLQIGGYELLKRTAARAGDAATQQLCETVLAEKRGMAEQLAGSFESAVQSTLEALRG